MRSSSLRDMGVLLLGAGVGAGLTLLLEPRGGGYRRSLIREKAIHVGKSLGAGTSKRSRYLAGRLRGYVLEIRKSGELVDDDTLEARVRAQIGHVIQSEHTIEIHAQKGSVKLNGTVLPGEKERIRQRLAKTRGVRMCDLSGIEERDRDSVRDFRKRNTGS